MPLSLFERRHSPPVPGANLRLVGLVGGHGVALAKAALDGVGLLPQGGPVRGVLRALQVPGDQHDGFQEPVRHQVARATVLADRRKHALHQAAKRDRLGDNPQAARTAIESEAIFDGRDGLSSVVAVRRRERQVRQVAKGGAEPVHATHRGERAR